MTGPLNGPGVPLQVPQNLYPSELANAPADLATNTIALASGEVYVLPRGDWLISEGMYSVVQYLDPVSNTWMHGTGAAWSGETRLVSSDGFNVRIANMTGCPVRGVVRAPGSGYVQATTSISVVGGGGSTWLPIIGGQLFPFSTTFGGGYGISPRIFIPAPPPPANNSNGVGGIAAEALVATLTSGTVAAVSMTNPGAGYSGANGTTVVGICVPSPFDPNLSSGITAATVYFSVGASGSVTGVLCTNSGAPLANPVAITLSIAGVGATATIAPVMMQSVNSVSLTGTGSGMGVSFAGITSLGGAGSLSTFTNDPTNLYLQFRPRPVQAYAATAAAGTVSATVATIIDGGLFEGTPFPVVLLGSNAGSGPGAGTVISNTIAFSVGAQMDRVKIQKLG